MSRREAYREAQREIYRDPLGIPKASLGISTRDSSNGSLEIQHGNKEESLKMISTREQQGSSVISTWEESGFEQGNDRDRRGP